METDCHRPGNLGADDQRFLFNIFFFEICTKQFIFYTSSKDICICKTSTYNNPDSISKRISEKLHL